jgi:hypothetical protein
MIKTVIFALGICGTVSAQWLHYPTAGIPLTPDGKPNLSAPAPRTADGQLDLSGIWEAEHQPCPPGGCSDYPAAREFGDLGASIGGGLPYQPWAAELVKKRTADLGRDDPVARCMPSGVIRLFTYPPPRKILQLPGLVVVLSERDVTYRQIFTDGRPLPKDPEPSWNGYSTGRWDKDTLVVETNGFRDGIWLDRKGSPMTEGAKMTERFRRLNYGSMEIEIAIDDPKAYTKPWSVKLKESIVLNTELLDYFCMDNEKDLPHMVGK